MIKVGILGYGTVGSGVFEIIRKNSEIIAKRAGREIQVKSVLDLRDFPGDPVEGALVHDFARIDGDDEIQIIVETMGGIHPAYEFVKSSLEKGRSVCTSNKELVASHGAELIETAEKNGCNFLFEASVGGGIPIIRPLQTSLAPDEILSIMGILNGTTNYILAEMTEKGLSFEEALKDAQDRGYAEKDPTADIEGCDACRKIAILMSLAYGRQLDFEDIYTEGISKIDDRDIKYAKKLKKKVKMLAFGKKEGEKAVAMVAPRLISPDHPLYSVDGVYNAILVTGNMVGDVMFYGQGAGKHATASAVVSDVMEAAGHIGTNIKTLWSEKKLLVAPFEGNVSRFFVRLSGTRKDNEERAAKHFEGIEPVDAGYGDEYAFVTRPMAEKKYDEISRSLGNVINRIRMDG